MLYLSNELPTGIAMMDPHIMPKPMNIPTKIPTCSRWSSLTKLGALMAHSVLTYPFEIENKDTIKILNQSLAMNELESPMTTIQMANTTVNPLKIAKK